MTHYDLLMEIHIFYRKFGLFCQFLYHIHYNLDYWNLQL